MKITSYFNQIFIKVFAAFILLNFILGLILTYQYGINEVSKDLDRMNRMLDKEKSYFSYVYLNNDKSDSASLTIKKINEKLKYLQVLEVKSNDVFRLEPVVINFAGRDLKTFYPEIIWKSVGFIYLLAMLFGYVLLSFVLLFTFSRFLRGKVRKDIVLPLSELDYQLQGGLERFMSFDGKNDKKVFEIHRVFKNLSEEVHKYIELKDKISEYEKDEVLADQTKQLAHDIRSPLEALKSISNNLEGLDSMSKSIVNSSIGRIGEIANDLLSKNKIQKKQELFGLRILFEELLYNKERERNVTFQTNFATSYSNSFICANQDKVYRCISNLLNNAIECQIPGEERIAVSLREEASRLTLSIKDFGTGMNEELLEKALNGGFTTKENGHGIGLSSSRLILTEQGGDFSVTSIEDEGTTIEVVFDIELTPSWFAESIVLKSADIGIIDDDLSFHRLYQQRFNEFDLNLISLNGRERSFEQYKSCTQWFVDYDLGEDLTGLDLIEKYNLQDRSLLVTSNYLDEDVQKKCINIGIKIIPKQIFNNIQITKELESTEIKQRVLIDDDDLIHLSWQMAARKSEVKLSTFHTVEEFLAVSDQFSKNTDIFVDSNLANNIKGEIESKKIANKGFENIYLATGYSADDLELPYWIKEVTGKRANF